MDESTKQWVEISIAAVSLLYGIFETYKRKKLANVLKRKLVSPSFLNSGVARTRRLLAETLMAERIMICPRS
ncbi:MAG TPA: hypothetical protein VIJ27_03810 [Mucilaginibacter sp.]